MELHLDLETYSSENIKVSGNYKYVESPDFEILLLSYKINRRPTKCIELARGQQIPGKLIKAIKSRKVKKFGWNVLFEFLGLQKHLKCKLDFSSWFCTMTKAAYNGYPLALDSAGKVLVPQLGKLESGKALIKYFCQPCKPTKANGYRFRNFPNDAPDKWREFKLYNIRDVDTETAIDDRLPYDMPEAEQQLYRIDHIMNRLGIRVDRLFISRAIALDANNRRSLLQEAARLTGCENPNSPAQLLKWLRSTTGQEIENLKAETVTGLLKHYTKGIVNRVLTIRKELALSSVKKYKRMVSMLMQDGCIRGLLQFYGANRTGRWAGRGVQVHNLARQGDFKLPALELMRKIVLEGFDRKQALMIYDDVTYLLKVLVRTAFVPPPGKRFIVADYSAIEARIIAWLAGEKWRMDIFNTHGLIYEASASKMLKVPLESVVKGSILREKGKVSELALGYQGAVGALIQMGALKMGLREDELLPLVKLWRKENKNIVNFWYESEKAFKAAFQFPGKRIYFCRHILSVVYKNNRLCFKLPAGRELFYPNAQLSQTQGITYRGMDQKTGRWVRISLYGGKIVENAVQAIARDLLAGSLVKLVNMGFEIPLHVHDELVAQVPKHAVDNAIHVIKKVMNTTPAWAEGLPLKCDIFDSVFYRKN